MAKAKKAIKKAKELPSPSEPKRSLAANRRRRRARKNPGEPRSNLTANPPILADFTHVLLPGFAAYAATRVLTRIVYSIVQKRWPKLGKHAAAAAGAAGFAGVWFFAHKVKRLEPYHDGVVMGSGVAALHGVAQCYLPKKYAWLLADCQPEDVAPAVAPGSQLQSSASAPTGGAAATCKDEYSYLEDQIDAMDGAGDRRTRIARPPKATRTPVANAMHAATGGDASEDLDPDLVDELDDDEDVDDLYSGSFATN